MICVESQIVKTCMFSMYFIRIHFTNNQMKGFTPGTMAFKILFCCQIRTILIWQDTVPQQPLIPSLQTSIHNICIREKWKQAAQLPPCPRPVLIRDTSKSDYSLHLPPVIPLSHSFTQTIHLPQG